MSDARAPDGGVPSRPRFVRCEKHGRIYDAAKETGCPQCRGESTAPARRQAAAPAPTRKQGLPQQAVLGVLAVVAVLLVAPQLLRQHDQDAAVPDTGDTSEAKTGPAAAAAAPGNAAALHGHLTNYVNDLERILRYYRPTLLSFSDTLSPEAEREYNRVARALHEALDAAQRRIPLQQRNPPRALSNARTSADNAVTYMKSAAPRAVMAQNGFPATATNVQTNVPRRNQMSLQLLRAEREIQRARGYLAKAPSP